MSRPPKRIPLLLKLERAVRQRRKLVAAWLRLQTGRSISPANSPDISRGAAGRKAVLFIDAQVPTPDQDAGSRSVFCQMDFLRRAGWSVVFMTDSPETRPAYARRLEKLGMTVLAGDYFLLNWEAWLKQNGPLLDAVIVNRSHVAVKWLGKLRRHSRAPIIFYGHDLLSRSLRRAYEELGEPQHLESAREHEMAEQAAILESDFIFYPSVEEVRWLSKLYPKKRIARVPLYVFDPPQRDSVEIQTRKDILFVGGFDHRPNEDAVLWFVESAWPLISCAWPECVFQIAGSKPTDKIRALASERIRIHGYLPESDLAALHRSCRLSVAPLRYGGGIKGKILQAMHLGTPVVTTPIGAEGLDWSRQTMRVCSLKDFGAQVAALYGDESSQADIRQNAWDFLTAEFSESALGAALLPALEKNDSAIEDKSVFRCNSDAQI